MAQVTMDSKEYLELVDKARQLEKFKNHLVDSIEVKIDRESSWNLVRVAIHPLIPQETLDQMVELITDTIMTEDQVMRALVEGNTHFLNIMSGQVVSRWDDKPEEDEVDLLQNSKFRNAWEAIKQEEE